MVNKIKLKGKQTKSDIEKNFRTIVANEITMKLFVDVAALIMFIQHEINSKILSPSAFSTAYSFC